MRIALDTNILAYAEGLNGTPRKRMALEILDRLSGAETLVPVQALGELFAVLVRKGGRTPVRARDVVLSWGDAFETIDTSAEILETAMELAAGHRLGIWDAIILSASSAVGCRYLLSEDLQDGFTWNRVTVMNPFVAGTMEKMLVD
jgi:predicted nucleic acid-binding protein